MDDRALDIQHCMYQYSRAIYRSIKDLVDPYVTTKEQAEYREERCSRPASRRWSGWPAIRSTSRSPSGRSSRTFGATSRSPRRPRSRGRSARASTAAVSFIEEQIEAGAFDGGVPRCHATTRKGKPCQRTPLPERDYCPSHQHLERSQSRRRVREWRATDRGRSTSLRAGAQHFSIATGLSARAYACGKARAGVECASASLRVVDPAEDDVVARVQARELGRVEDADVLQAGVERLSRVAGRGCAPADAGPTRARSCSRSGPAATRPSCPR